MGAVLLIGGASAAFAGARRHSSADPQGAALDPGFFSRIASGVVPIRGFGCTGAPRITGTGFLVGSGVVMTARQVVDPGGTDVRPACRVKVRVDGHWVAATKIGWWYRSAKPTGRATDLATLKLAEPASSSDYVFGFRNSSPRLGTNLSMLGHPVGNGISLTQGRLRAKTHYHHVPLLIIDLLGTEGASGSPIVDGGGHVAGVLQVGLGGRDILGQRTSGVVAGIDLPRWWGGGRRVEQALCHAYPRGGIPNCGNPAIPPAPTPTTPTTSTMPTATTTPATATTPQPPPVGPGPLRLGPTGRYLVDQNGVPFLISGESPQALIGDLTESDAALFFANRRAHGFNTVWINVLCNDYTGCRADGSTWDGIPPFTTPGDFATPNEAYFAHVDRILRLAADYGFVVILDPAETGGWLSTMVDNGVDKLRAYGQYLGRRYKDFPNIIWMSGNDYQDWGPTFDPYVTAVAQGIRDVDPRHLQTVELNYLVSGSLDDPAWAPLIDLNASYSYGPTYQQVLQDYNRSNFLPTFLVEASYEFEQNPGAPAGTPQQLRRQEYWSLLSGATGQLYGNHYTWQFLCPQRDDAGNCVGGWKDQLDTSGAQQMAYVKTLFESRRWYALVPDQAHTVVTNGFGTFGANDYVTAARTSDGTLAIAYVPSNRTITVDLSTLSGPVTARWYDPTAGTFTSISDAPFANVGSISVATPGTNAAGDDDWVLVLEAH